MFRTMLKSKIHRATVTQADLHYVGSVTIDEDLMDAANLLPGEQVAIVDIDNGARLETYVIPGQRGSGVIGINGAAARLVAPGDLVIIISYMGVSDAEARTLKPQVVHVDGRNRIVVVDGDPAAPVPGIGTARGDLRGDGLYDPVDEPLLQWVNPMAAAPAHSAHDRSGSSLLTGELASRSDAARSSHSLSAP